MARGLPEHKSIKQVTLSSWDQGGHGPQGAFHPGKEKALGRPQSIFQHLKGIYRRAAEELWRRVWRDRTRGNGFREKVLSSDQILGRNV